MKNSQAGAAGIITLLCVASSFVVCSPEPSLAQRGGPGASAAERRIETLRRQGEQYEREKLAREREGKPASTAGRARAKGVAEQVERDFEGLQAGYNRIVLAMASKERIDMEEVLESVAEVRKRAARLKENLALPRAEEDEEKGRQGVTGEAAEAGEPSVEQLLAALRRHIYSFVTNPLFEAAPVLDVEQARKAGRDLDMILELSERLRGGGRQGAARH